MKAWIKPDIFVVLDHWNNLEVDIIGYKNNKLIIFIINANYYMNFCEPEWLTFEKPL